MLNISCDPRRKYVLGELEAEAAPCPPSSGPDSASWIRVINLGSGAASNLIWKRSYTKSLTRMQIRNLKSPGPDSASSGASNTETAPVPPLPCKHLNGRNRCQLKFSPPRSTNRSMIFGNCTLMTNNIFILLLPSICKFLSCQVGKLQPHLLLSKGITEMTLQTFIWQPIAAMACQLWHI